MKTKHVVCTKYCGAVIELASFDLLSDAEMFMTKPFVLYYADEMENGEEDEVVYPYEMWVEDEKPTKQEDTVWLNLDQPLDELPF